jgi:hypothetical protein
MRRHKNNGHIVSFLCNQAQQVKTADVRKLQIEENEVRSTLTETIQPLASGYVQSFGV